MGCNACGASNPADHRFCAQCGTPLVPSCPACAAEIAPDARFCGLCGTSLARSAEADARQHPAPAEAPRAAAERRQVCVLFVDLVAFTTHAEQRDPEAVRELLSAYFDEARTIVGRYGGTVEKFIGDAVMAVWGTPVAREDDAERAVRAALDVVDAVTALGERRGVPTLRARAGVVTGEAAVRLDAVDQSMVAGDVVNTAARVQAIAEPGRVLVDDVTREASLGAIAYRGMGEHQLKGRETPVVLHAALEVIAGSGGSQRADGIEPPFVGRERDLRMLKELLHDTVEQSRAQLVLVTGGPGVGKSRLRWELFKYLDGIEQRVLWHAGRSLAYGEGISYWALAEMVRMRLRVSEGDPAAEVAAKLDDGLVTYVPDEDDRAWLRPRLAVLLGISDPSDEVFDRDALFAGWRLFLEYLADRHPVVLVFEDAQDADEGLLDFVDHLLENAADRPFFVLVLARPELHDRRPAWGHQRHASVLHLDRLPDDRIETLVDGIVDELPDAARRLLAARAEGIPLFAVETVRMLVDRDVVVPRGGRYVFRADVDALEDLEVPATLQALVAARLDDLPDRLRRLVGAASVLGRSFTAEAVTAVAVAAGDVDADEVPELLRELTHREVLTMRADPRSPEAGQYRFVQRVMQTVAHQRLSRDDRKARHLAAAEHLRSAPESGEIAGLIAMHYLGAADARPDAPDAAELRATAVQHLVRAGDRARSLAAIGDALRYYERALELCGPADRARLLELAGIAAQQVVQLDRAQELLSQAREEYAAAGDSGGVARVASWQAETMLDLGRLEEGFRLVTSAWTGDDGPPDADAARLASAIGMVALNRPELGEDPGPWLDRASRIAELTGAWDVLARALSLRGIRLSLESRPVEAHALTTGVFELARRHALHFRAAIQATYLSWWALERDLEEGQRWADEAAEQSRRSGDRWTRSVTRDLRAGVAFERGAWDEIDVAGLRDEWVAAYRDGAVGQAPPTLVHIATSTGDLTLLDGGDPEEMLQRDDSTLRADGLTYRALLAAADGDHRAALEAAEDALELHQLLSVAPLQLHALRAIVVDAGLALGELEHVRGVVRRDPYRAPDTPSGAAHRSWAAARLAAADGAPAVDVEAAFTHAAEAFRELRRPYWLARVLLDHAEWGAGGGDPSTAGLASDALSILRELGAAPLAARAARLTEHGVPA